MKEIIDKIFDKYTKKVWLNAIDYRFYIPAENISPLKQELYDTLMLTKGNKNGGKSVL